MSLPSIPDIDPKITLDRCDVINLLLSSIAMQEMGLSNLLTAEGEKLITFLQQCPCPFQDYLRINESINRTLRTVVNSQILLQFKLEDVITLNEQSNCDPKPCDPHCKCKCKCKHDGHKECKCDCKCKHCHPPVDFYNDSLCYCPNKHKKDCQCSKCKEDKNQDNEK